MYPCFQKEQWRKQKVIIDFIKLCDKNEKAACMPKDFKEVLDMGKNNKMSSGGGQMGSRHEGFFKRKQRIEKHHQEQSIHLWQQALVILI